MKNRKTSLVYILLCLAIILTSVATTLALVSDEYSKTGAIITFDRVSIMGDEENGSNLSFTLASDCVGDGELVFNGSGERDYLWIRPTSDTVDMFLRFRVYFTLGSEELDTENAETLELLNNGDGVPQGFKLYKEENLDYELIPYNGWIYVTTVSSETIEPQNKILKVIQNTTKENRNYIISKEYTLDYDKINDEETIFNMINQNDNQITLKVEAHAIQCFGLKDSIEDVLEKTQSSSVILNSFSNINLEENYGNIKIKQYHQAVVEMEALKGDLENPLNVTFNEKGMLDVYSNKNLKLKRGSITLENSTDAEQYVGNFSTTNQAYYENKNFAIITTKLDKSFKMETLFKLDSNYDFKQEQYILSMTDNSMYLKINTSKKLIFGLKIGQEVKTLSYDILAGQFINIIVTFNGTNLSMYCNSILVSSLSMEGDVNIRKNHDNLLLIGAHKNTTIGNYFNGSLAFIKISAIAPTYTDIRSSFTYGVTPDIFHARPQSNGNLKNLLTNTNFTKKNTPSVTFDNSLNSYICSFNGSNAYTWSGITTYYNNIKYGFTIECIVKTTNTHSDGKFISNQQTSGISLGYYSYGSRIYAECYLGGAYRQVTNISIPTNTFIHIVFTYDTNYIKLYVNGILRGQNYVRNYASAITMPSGNSRYLAFGADSGFSQNSPESYGIMSLEYARMYKSVLNAKQIRKMSKI